MRTSYPKLRKKSRRKKRYALLISMAILLSLILLGLFWVDKSVFPIIEDASIRSARGAVNELLADSVRNYVRERNISSADFYSISESGGKLSSLEVNTLLVNDICAEIADKVSGGLNELGATNLDISSGTLGGLSFLANRGPFFNVKVLPRGSATVDYDSEFAAAGINQVNFQIWLNVRAEVKVVSIRDETPLTVERRIPIVNTVFSGDIPNTYLDLKGGSE